MRKLIICTILTSFVISTSGCGRRVMPGAGDPLGGDPLAGDPGMAQPGGDPGFADPGAPGGGFDDPYGPGTGAPGGGFNDPYAPGMGAPVAANPCGGGGMGYSSAPGGQYGYSSAPQQAPGGYGGGYMIQQYGGQPYGGQQQYDPMTGQPMAGGYGGPQGGGYGGGPEGCGPGGINPALDPGITAQIVSEVQSAGGFKGFNADNKIRNALKKLTMSLQEALQNSPLQHRGLMIKTLLDGWAGSDDKNWARQIWATLAPQQQQQLLSSDAALAKLVRKKLKVG